MTRPQLHLTRPDETPAPRRDADSLLVLEGAIQTLSRLRTPYWLGDSGVYLHALASLITQPQHLLPDAVTAARDQELTWAEIGQLLGVSSTSAARPL